MNAVMKSTREHVRILDGMKTNLGYSYVVRTYDAPTKKGYLAEVLLMRDDKLELKP